jgi:hypothetical protein
VVSIVDASEVHACSILSVKMSRVDECSCYTEFGPTEPWEKCGAGVQYGPIGDKKN